MTALAAPVPDSPARRLAAPLAPDLVQRDFTAPGPNRLCVTDLTMISTDEGPLWLSAIRDAFSRRVVAWETSARADAGRGLRRTATLAATARCCNDWLNSPSTRL